MITHRCAIDLFAYCISPDLQTTQDLFTPEGTLLYTAALTCPNSPPECPHYRTFTQVVPPSATSPEKRRTTIKI